MAVSDVENKKPFKTLVQVPNTCLRWFHKNVNKWSFNAKKNLLKKCNEKFSLHLKYEYTCVYYCFKLFVCHSQMD